MFFSIFGSKKEKAARRKGADTVSRPESSTASSSISQREIARRTAEKIDEIESQMDLAIPARVAKPDATPVADEMPPVPARMLPPSVEEGDMVVFPAPGSGPANGSDPSLLPPHDSNPTDFLGETRAAQAVEVLTSGLLPVFEEAAVLFANGQSNDAAMILWQAIKENQLGKQADQAWKMMFELYQAAGRRQEFESLALDYASRFESSPPTWHDDLTPPDANKAPRAVSSAVAFPPKIDAQAIRQIEQLQRAAQRNRPADVDFGRVTSVDPVGAELLLKALADFRKNAGTLTIAGIEALAAALADTTETGRRDESDTWWQLRLEVLRLLGDQPAFEDLAIDFCVTYEVSPPSWEALPASIRLRHGKATSDAEAPHRADTGAGAEGVDGMFPLEGEIEGRPEETFKALREFAEDRSEVLIDCRRLRRVDFVCAGEVLNEIAGLQATGKSLVFKDLSYLVASLMMVMGIHEMAELKLRVN